MWDFEMGHALALMGRTSPFTLLCIAAAGLALLLGIVPARAQSGTGAIEGTIGYPSEELPAMHVYAVPFEGGPVRRVETSRGASRFAIRDLPAGRYHVIAFPAG